MFTVPQDKKLILFDGVCNFCNSSVNFIIDRDVMNVFVFASLQSEIGQSVLKHFSKPLENYDSLILLDQGQISEKSTAALKIASDLCFPWNIFRLLLFFPSLLRDPLYIFIAKNRYRFFGRRQFCRLPTEAERKKILG